MKFYIYGCCIFFLLKLDLPVVKKNENKIKYQEHKQQTKLSKRKEKKKRFAIRLFFYLSETICGAFKIVIVS